MVPVTNLINRPLLTAAPQLDGIVVIFDIETNGVARKLRGHTRQVQSLRCASHATSTPPAED